MSNATPLWGAPRIHGELLKLGIDVGQTTVAKYLAKRRRPPSQVAKRIRGTVDRLDQAGLPGSAGPRRIAPSIRSDLISGRHRDCLDQVVVFGERHLRHLLESYQRYYNEARTHLSLSKDAPVSRAVQTVGSIIAKPLLG
jgi:hypothetical protein